MEIEKTSVAVREDEGTVEQPTKRMAILDFSSLDTKTQSEAGAALHLEDPRTGEPLYLADGSAVTITFLGPDSAKVRLFQRTHTDEVIDALRNKKQTKSSAENERRMIKELAEITLRWNVPPKDGQPIPCTAENARALYGDPRLPWIVEQAAAFVSDRIRFFKAASAN